VNGQKQVADIKERISLKGGLNTNQVDDHKGGTLVGRRGRRGVFV